MPYKDPEHRRAYKHRWYIAHQTLTKERARQWRLNHLDHVKATKQTYYLNNRERIANYKRRWQERHHERLLQYYRNHYQVHKSDYLTYMKHRRRIVRSRGPFTKYKRRYEWLSMLEYFDYRCLRCQKSGTYDTLVVDHIRPISRGGTNTLNNIQPLCDPCNRWKGRRIISYR